MKKSNSKHFKNFKKRFLNKTSVALIFLFFLAVILRSYNLSNSLFFGPEQGIDFLRMKSIAVDHRPVLVGAKTDIAGIFHGPIYYYAATIPFLLSHGDPFFIAFFLILINSCTVFLIYLLGREMFSRRVGLIAAILFSISFGAITYTHWLSSHPLVIPLSALFLLGIYNFLQGKRKYLYLASISYALLGQAEFLNYLLFGVILLAVIVVFFKQFKKQPVWFLLGNVCIIFLFGFLHYVIFEWRNQFIMTKSLFALSNGGGFYISYTEAFRQVYEVGTRTLVSNILPFVPKVFALLLFFAGLIVLLKSTYSTAKKLIIMQICIPLAILILLRHSILEQFFVFAIVSEILITSFFIEKVINKKRIVGFLLLFFFVLIQLWAWFLNVPENEFMFFSAAQPDLFIKDEKAVIDEIYKREKGKDFSFQSYTIPYWSQQGWEYLFWQYGKQKYGYAPVLQNGRTIYVIVQDDLSSKQFQDDWLKYTVSKWGVLKSTFRRGIFTVRVQDVPWIK